MRMVEPPRLRPSWDFGIALVIIVCSILINALMIAGAQ